MTQTVVALRWINSRRLRALASANDSKQTLRRVINPNVRLLIGAALVVEVDFDWRQRPFKRVTTRFLKRLFRPVLPERDGFGRHVCRNLPYGSMQRVRTQS